jgi:hypothetical protein
VRQLDSFWKLGILRTIVVDAANVSLDRNMTHEMLMPDEQM